MGSATRVSFTHFYSMWNCRQGWGLVVVATIIIIMCTNAEVKTFSIISYEYTKPAAHSSKLLYRIFNSFTAKTDAHWRLLRYI